ncbi:SCO2525 family SAM-dependent methyltransferase [Catellatospora bangladeshensis]|uniref:Methyltransferase n=1 Tax=Catellatospora bangladeshensis TaxID=310355 RepID=A0A8J3JB62_9ACTN|nr:SCO2525 family SAM-dependent methyltransferase [Catellatospora bangladeshensis]GIF81617.1 hypothetical protein Cba03nite_29660 [Catellatospora bangladeshensis]
MSATGKASLVPAVNNAECPWDLFDSESYQQRNYATLHELDQIIIPKLAGFFAKQNLGSDLEAIDVGPGTNLYPAMSMLPFTKSITLLEYSSTNIAWLEDEIGNYRESWNAFWRALADSSDHYGAIADPGVLLKKVADVQKGSIFDLKEGRWDLGTMFFVAESITGMRDECAKATTRFVRSLKPGAPFAATFMENSRGYVVGGHTFPAVAVTEADVRTLLRGVAGDIELHHIRSPHLFRHGYDGMMLVTGVRSDTRSEPSREPGWTTIGRTGRRDRQHAAR